MSPVLPGATIGILGGGQLGRMIAVSARQFGYRVVVLSPEADAPACGLADRVIHAAFDDLDAARALAGFSDVVTYEFENVPAATASVVEATGKLRPNAELLRISQDRNLEHAFLHALGIPTAPGRVVCDEREFDAAVAQLGLPCRIKSARGGYDGGGQFRLFDADSLALARASLATAAGGWRAEGEVRFEREISVVLARSSQGNIVPYPPFENVHREGILQVSSWPAAGSPKAHERATAAAAAIAEKVGLVGVMCVEFFVVGDEVLVNELAPRVHNSGHLTIEGAAVSQFEQHLRAICGLPLLAPALRMPAVAMVNLLGTADRRSVRLAGVNEVLADPSVHLHLYGKDNERAKRKMGHITVTGATAAAARERALSAAARVVFQGA